MSQIVNFNSIDIIQNYQDKTTVTELIISNINMEFPTDLFSEYINVVKITIEYCNITQLPTLPSNLTELSCKNNRLTSLPDLPPTLIKLYCENNKLITFPSLPSTLTTLWCDNNQLILNLITFPVSLVDLKCENNL